MDVSDIKISVIIPVYNPGKYLRGCLDSVCGQTHRNLEIILIDDGSKDGSAEVCDEYAAKDARIICRHQQNAGVSNARNNGMALAHGDFYHFFDSDDYLETDTYEYLLRKMTDNHAEAIAFEYFINFPNREVTHRLSEERYGLKDTAGAIYNHLLGGNSFLCTKLLPAAAVSGLSLREDIYRDEDTLFGWQALRRVKSVYADERPVLHYVQSEESACRGKFRVNQLSAVKVIPIVEEFLNNEYPQWLTQWRRGYMHLMIMLYADMYFDEEAYPNESKMIYRTFMELYRKAEVSKIRSRKVKIKFRLFRCSPHLFCRVHRRNID